MTDSIQLALSGGVQEAAGEERDHPRVGALAGPRPCRCHKSHAYIGPIHLGHCCFLPATQTCHPEEMAAWVEADRRWFPTGRSAS